MGKQDTPRDQSEGQEKGEGGLRRRGMKGRGTNVGTVKGGELEGHARMHTRQLGKSYSKGFKKQTNIL